MVAEVTRSPGRRLGGRCVKKRTLTLANGKTIEIGGRGAKWGNAGELTLRTSRSIKDPYTLPGYIPVRTEEEIKRDLEGQLAEILHRQAKRWGQR
jgi:hypothetical protein